MWGSFSWFCPELVPICLIWFFFLWTWEYQFSLIFFYRNMESIHLFAGFCGFSLLLIYLQTSSWWQAWFSQGLHWWVVCMCPVFADVAVSSRSKQANIWWGQCVRHTGYVWFEGWVFQLFCFFYSILQYQPWGLFCFLSFVLSPDSWGEAWYCNLQLKLVVQILTDNLQVRSFMDQPFSVAIMIW